MKRILASVIVLSLGMSQVGVAQSTTLTRSQALSRLNSLIPVYQVDLDVDKHQQVIGVCRSVQSNTLQPLSTDLKTTKKSYQDTANSVDLSIRFVANALRGMSEDSSTMDLASFHLGERLESFELSIGVYERVLEELLIIDCQVSPEAFVAGLEEARERKKIVEASAAKMHTFLTVELKASLAQVQSRLELAEARR